MPLIKTQLPCCAMCFLSNTNEFTTEKELNKFIDKLKKEAFEEAWKNNDRRSGERTILTVVSPYELPLGVTLEKVGFKLLGEKFNRRFGYPPGQLKLYSYSF